MHVLNNQKFCTELEYGISQCISQDICFLGLFIIEVLEKTLFFDTC